MRHLEHDMQVRFFHVVGIASNRYPRLKFIHAIPNGGKRHVRVAMKMKAEGVKRGVADVFVPLIGYGGQHGLYLEFKAGKNDLTPEQQEFRDFVEREGFVYRCCYSTEEAIFELEKYLGIKILESPRPK
jgi:hypothetical protein